MPTDDHGTSCSTTRSRSPREEFDKTQLLKLEREMLGLYVSDHPLFGTERVLEQHVDVTCADLQENVATATTSPSAGCCPR
jgi:DNA polymerase III subunit alpha